MSNRSASYRFGDLEVLPDRNEIIRGAASGSLPKQSMDILVYLIEHRDRVVSGDELLGAFWQGRVVEESTIHRQISQIRSALGDSARSATYIRTVPKRGYQFVAEIAPDAALAPAALSPGRIVPASPPALSWRVALPVSLIAVVALLLLVDVSRDPGPTLESRSSVAVLPLDSIGSIETTDARAALGVTEELLSRLSERRHLRVASRTDTASVIREGKRMSELADALNVAYLVEGSVQQTGERLRITAQLIRASSGFHVWSADHDVRAGELDQQAQVARSIAHVIEVRMREDIRRSHPLLFEKFRGVDPDAVSLFLDAEEEFNAYAMGENGDPRLAMQLLERAVRVAPGFEAAQMELAWNYAHRVNPSLPASEASRRAKQALAPILERHPDSDDAIFYLAQVYLLLDLDYDRATETIERGLELNPTGRWWNIYLSQIARREGRLLDALRLQERNLTMDYGEETAAFLNTYAVTLNDVGEYRRAIDVSQQVLDIASGGQNRAVALLQMANAHIRLEQPEMAIPLVDEAWQLAGTTMPGVFGEAFARLGQINRALQSLDADVPGGLRGYAAEGYLALGRTDRAFDLLAEGIDERDSSVLDRIRSSPSLVALAGEPRYRSLLDRLGELETQTRPTDL